MSKFEEIPEQPDRVAGRAIMWILIATAVTIVACAFVVWLYGPTPREGSGRSAQVQERLVPPTYPFELKSPLEAERDAQRLELDQWQWADRMKHRVLVPVDVAIDRYLAQRGAP